MKPFFLPGLIALSVVSFSSGLRSADPGKWPFQSETRLEAVLAVLRWKLYSEAGFSDLPRGVTLGLDVAEVPEEGWYQVTLREFHSKDSGFDPNVAPAIEHFYVRESDGSIEWLDLVENERQPWSAFLQSRRAP
jgi:hypothetical protein